MTTTARTFACIVIGAALACSEPDAQRLASLKAEDARPEALLPGDLAGRPDSALLARTDTLMDTDEEAQPDSLPALPFGLTLEMIRAGDALFHGAGGCFNCHGSEAQGLPARGKTITAGLHFVSAGDWRGVDSIISVGIPDAGTRSPVAMPPRGQHGDLDASQIQALSAYVWGISSARGEPWPGGHVSHARHDPRASARTSIP
ncbi:MAG: c-type cytochrome [Gemmatimonadota bacterium]